MNDWNAKTVTQSIDRAAKAPVTTGNGVPDAATNLALFDFDGTITTSDTWTPFLRFAVRPFRLVTGQLLLLPVVAGCGLGVLSSSRGRQIAARVAFRGEDAAALRSRGAEYATNALPRTLRPGALDRIAWHKSQGDLVVVVSAGLDVYLGPWCHGWGLDCLCTTLEERSGRLTGRCVYGDCSGAEKARRIKERYDLDQYAIIYAYGDSIDDREMLGLAHKKYFRWREISGGRA